MWQTTTCCSKSVRSDSVRRTHWFAAILAMSFRVRKNPDQRGHLRIAVSLFPCNGACLGRSGVPTYPRG